MTLDHLIALSKEILDEVYVPLPSIFFRGGATSVSVVIPKCVYCGSLTNRDRCCALSKQCDLDYHAGAKGVSALRNSVAKTASQLQSASRHSVFLRLPLKVSMRLF